MLCYFGCGNEGLFLRKTGYYCCSKASSSCPKIKEKNSLAIKKAHADGKLPGWNGQKNLNRGWSKGLLKQNDNTFSYNGKGNHKALLIQERSHTCEECKNSKWMNKPITLELEHIDGNNKNNNKENLKLLCPNCHSQTLTWKKKKTKKQYKKYSIEEMKEAILTSYSMNEALNKLNMNWGSYHTLKKIINDYNIFFKIK